MNGRRLSCSLAAASLALGGPSCRLFAPRIARISPSHALTCATDHRHGAPLDFGAFLGNASSPTAITASIEKFRDRVGVSPRIVRVYTNLGRSIDASGDLAGVLTAIEHAGSTPMLVIEPTSIATGTGLLGRIAGGESDSLLLLRARELNRLGLSSLLIELAPEMNGRFGAAWQAEANQPNPAQTFVWAWRRMVTVMRAGGLGGARWVWSPTAGNAYTHAATGLTHWNNANNYYPGDDVVDVIGLHAFNDPLSQRAWVPFVELVDGDAADHSLSMLSMMHPGKPMMLTEIATDEHPRDRRAKSRWVTDMFDQLTHCTSVVAVVWFDLRKERAWGITSSRASAAAFKYALAGMAPPS